MLSALKSAARTAVKSTRSLTTVPNAGSNLLSASLARMGEISTGSTEAFEGVGSPKPLDLSSLRLPTKEPPMFIPPAQDPLLHYISSTIMRDGKRNVADRTVSRMLLHIHALTRAPPLPVVREAVLAVSPMVKCVTQRRSVKTIYKPIALSERHRTRFALKWLLASCKNRKERTLEERLARELIAVLQGSSDALKKKEEAHKLAMVNRANVTMR